MLLVLVLIVVLSITCVDTIAHLLARQVNQDDLDDRHSQARAALRRVYETHEVYHQDRRP